MEITNKILIVFAHPAIHKSRVNRCLIDAVKDLDGIMVHDLYATYPDYHINVKKEQELLLQHKIIVWQHPFYWYSSPALLKEWIDLVFEHGWAYGRNGSMLKGKQVLTSVTTGGTLQAYNKTGYNSAEISDFLLPFRQTAKLCKMSYLPPYLINGTHLLKEDNLIDCAVKYKKLLISLRDNIFSESDLFRYQYMNELIN